MNIRQHRPKSREPQMTAQFLQTNKNLCCCCCCCCVPILITTCSHSHNDVPPDPPWPRYGAPCVRTFKNPCSHTAFIQNHGTESRLIQRNAIESTSNQRFFFFFFFFFFKYRVPTRMILMCLLLYWPKEVKPHLYFPHRLNTKTLGFVLSYFLTRFKS